MKKPEWTEKQKEIFSHLQTRLATNIETLQLHDLLIEESELNELIDALKGLATTVYGDKNKDKKYFVSTWYAKAGINKRTFVQVVFTSKKDQDYYRDELLQGQKPTEEDLQEHGYEEVRVTGYELQHFIKNQIWNNIEFR
jgi:hypothetical protein